jgi:hypothetical protein
MKTIEGSGCRRGKRLVCSGGGPLHKRSSVSVDVAWGCLNVGHSSGSRVTELHELRLEQPLNVGGRIEVRKLWASRGGEGEDWVIIHGVRRSRHGFVRRGLGPEGHVRMHGSITRHLVGR